MPRSILLLLAPAVLLLVIQSVGGGGTDRDLQPLFDFPAGLYWPIVAIGMVLSLIAFPLTVIALLLAALRRAPWARRATLIMTCALFVATSFVGCAWSFGGHPTWIQGYSARKP